MGALNLPNVLKDANVYIDGADFLGKAEIELPKVAQEIVEHEGMGVSGKVEFPLPGITDKMEGKIKFNSFNGDALKRFYYASQAQQIDAWGSVQSYNKQSGTMDEFPVRVTIRGFFKEVDLPPFKKAQKDGPEVSYSAVYYKLVVNGEEVVEIDPLNYIYKVGGVDLLEKTRANLGMK